MKFFLQAIVLALVSCVVVGAPGGLRRPAAAHDVDDKAKLAHEGPLSEAGVHGAPAAHSEDDDDYVSAYQMPIKAVVALEGLASRSARRVANKVEQEPAKQGEADAGGSNLSSILWQLFFGVIYYFAIVQKYPTLKDKDDLDPAKIAKAKELQEESEITATFCQTSAPNCLFSWCCWAPRAAHNFHSTGILNYWLSLVLMACFPCCTLCYANAFTDLNEKLQGERRNVFMSMLCSCFCFCCVIAQDAESLDVLTGHQTTCCPPFVTEDAEGKAGEKRNKEKAAEGN